MAEPFLSEIRIFSFTIIPKGWTTCSGQLLPINQNQALFALLGTTYGGNGQTTFGLPNLQGSVPISTGSGFTLGQRAGEQVHTLTVNEMPAHAHTFNATNVAVNTADPNNALLGGSFQAYNASNGGVLTIAPQTIASVGGSQPHQNMQPYLVLNMCIALQGIFPSQN